jgi:hypothetical protein
VFPDLSPMPRNLAVAVCDHAGLLKVGASSISDSLPPERIPLRTYAGGFGCIAGRALREIPANNTK